MSKGKKFTAAEKHFFKKEEGYRKEQKRMTDELDAAKKVIAQLNARVSELEGQLVIALAGRDEALKLAGMTTEEMQKHLKQTQAAAEVCGILTTFSKFC